MSVEITYVDPAGGSHFFREWQQLAEGCDLSEPFSQPEFVRAAADMAREEVTPACMIVRLDGAVTGVLPLGFALRDHRWLPLPLIRSIAPGRIDFTTLLCQPQSEDVVIRAVTAELLRLARKGTTIDLRVIPFEQQLAKSVRPPLRLGTPSRMRTTNLDGMESWRDVMRDGHRRRELDRTMRRLGDAGARIVWADDSTAAGKMVHRFTSLHRAQQDSRSREQRFGIGRPTESLAALLSEWCTRGMADIALIELDGADIGGYILFHTGDSTWAYRTCFDSAHAKLAPGAALLASAIDVAIARGSRHFQFSWGDQPYKRGWSEESGTVVPLQSAPAGPAGLAARIAGKLLAREVRGDSRPGNLPRGVFRYQ